MALCCTQIVLSILMLSALSLERYIKLVHPFFYAKHITERRILCIILGCVLYSLLFGTLPMLGWNNVGTMSASGDPYTCRFEFVLAGSYVGTLFLGHIFPPFILLPMMHLHVFITAHKLLRRASRNAMQSVSTRNGRALLSIRRHHTCSCSSPNAAAVIPTVVRQRNLRHFKILVVMGLYFIVSWMPLTVWEIVLWQGFTKQSVSPSDFLHPPHNMIFYYIALALAIGNSAVNPVIFGAGNITIRKTLWRCLRCHKGAAGDDVYRSFHSLTDVRLRELHAQQLHQTRTAAAAAGERSPLNAGRVIQRPLTHSSSHTSFRQNGASHSPAKLCRYRNTTTAMSRSRSCPANITKQYCGLSAVSDDVTATHTFT